ncbi:OmpH family outer membrane protein [Fodinicurvata sediminis]|uniref:OmpH family outer membrane protein n=1 Tax=Fodinicurvata sediminis TaxID=1121832 RepID=UPI0004177AA8|nr:OmpH family outer membrane protein [Fodinicurvata sediminis]
MTFRNAFIAGFVASAMTVMASLGMAPQATAQDEMPTPKILVVDLQQVMREAEAMKGLREEAEGLRSEMEQELQQQEQSLREEDEALSRQRTVLSQDAFEEKRGQLEQKFSQFQSSANTEMGRLEEAYSEAVAEVEFTIVRISDDIAGERGANMVIPKSTLLLVGDDFEITEEVTTRLNEELPSVSLSLEESDSE